MSGDTGPRTGRLRAAFGGLLLVVLLASALYAGNVGGVRDTVPPPAERLPAAPETEAEPEDTGADAVEAAPARRSYPWWEELATFAGSEDTTTEAFAVGDRALQWRVAWRCETGSLRILRVAADGAVAERPLAEVDDCPAEGTGFAVDTGRLSLDVEADGPWEVTVEQQRDDPLVEEPTAAMRDPASEIVAEGTFYSIDRRTEGTVTLYRTADGRFEIRLEDFYATPDVDIELWFSELAQPESTGQVMAAEHAHVAFLEVTTGALNFAVPEDVEVDLDRFGSIVVWCQPLRLAYGAAVLEPAR